MNKGIRDAFLVAGFFVGYAFVLALIEQIDKKASAMPMDWSRLRFMRTQRDSLLTEEGITNGD